MGMNARLIVEHLRSHPWLSPIALRERWREAAGGHQQGDNRPHLEAALAWLCRAQDTAGGGFARGYSLYWHPYFRARGWQPAYPETTGYIIPTLYQAADQLGRPELLERAEQAARWKIDVQLPSGAVQGGVIGEPVSPAVFNTGQALLGWLTALGRTGDARFADAVLRAGRFLVDALGDDGFWRKGHSRFAMPGKALYNAQTAWALAEAGTRLGEPAFVAAARHHFQSVIALQHPDGWLPECCLDDPEHPLLHTLAYAVRGLLEGGNLLRDEQLLAGAGRAAASLASRVRERRLYGGPLRRRMGSSGEMELPYRAGPDGEQLDPALSPHQGSELARARPTRDRVPEAHAEPDLSQPRAARRHQGIGASEWELRPLRGPELGHEVLRRCADPRRAAGVRSDSGSLRGYRPRVRAANALILGDEPRIVVNVARSLARVGARVTVGKLAPAVRALPSRAIARYVRVPIRPDNSPLGAEALVALVRDHRFDVVVPCSDTALRLIRVGYADLSAVALLCCPDPDAIGRVLDKSTTLALATRCGIATPQEREVDSVSALAGRLPDIRFPVVAKPRSKEEQSRFKTLTISELSQLRELMSEDPDFGRRNLIQEFVPGHGVGVAMLFDGTRMLVGFQHRRLREYPVEGGVSVQAISEPVDAVLGEMAIRLLQEVRWQGVAMVEFRWDPVRKRAVLMEINGRYWGSLPLAIRAGVDFPRLELEWRRGAPPGPSIPYRAGTTMVWVRGMLLRIGQVVRRAVPSSTRPPSILGDLRVVAGVLTHPARDALWSAADPVPSVLEVLVTAGAAAAGLMKSVVRRLLPEHLAALFSAMRRVRPGARGTYLALRLRHWFGRPVRIEAQRWRGAKTMVFVCHGNIMRSAFAAARLRQLLGCSEPQMEVESAGVWAQAGKAAEPAARQAAAAFGVNLDDHRATPLTTETVSRADIIFVMDLFNLADVLARFPQARGKTQLLAGLGESEDEIADPYGRDVGGVSTAFSQIDRALETLLQQLHHGI